MGLVFATSISTAGTALQAVNQTAYSPGGLCSSLPQVVALLIMIVKAFFLSRVERANAKFLKQFRNLG